MLRRQGRWLCYAWWSWWCSKRVQDLNVFSETLQDVIKNIMFNSWTSKYHKIQEHKLEVITVLSDSARWWTTKRHSTHIIDRYGFRYSGYMAQNWYCAVIVSTTMKTYISGSVANLTCSLRPLLHIPGGATHISGPSKCWGLIQECNFDSWAPWTYECSFH